MCIALDIRLLVAEKKDFSATVVKTCIDLIDKVWRGHAMAELPAPK